MPDYTGGQFPSLDGNPAAEVAQRTEPETEGDWFRKVFTVHNRAHTMGLPEDHEIHQSNFIGTLQAALQQGLHPKSQPELESEEPHPFDPNHTNLVYRVQVVPAVADDDPGTTVTPSTLAQVQQDPDALQPQPEQTDPNPRWLTGETGQTPAYPETSVEGGTETATASTGLVTPAVVRQAPEKATED